MKKKLIKIGITIAVFVVIVQGIRLWWYMNSFTYLPSLSPTGVQLVAQTRDDFRSSHSDIYIKYPDKKKLVKTDVTISEDEGPALSDAERNSNQERLLIEWIDDNHVSITFAGRTNWHSPSVYIIEY